MKNMKMSNTDIILYNMLRQKQKKLDIYYLTSDSFLYKFFKFLFYLSFAACTFINLLSIISWSSQLKSDLSYLENATQVQSSVAASIKDGITAVAVFGILLFGSLVFAKLKKPVFTIIFTVIPAVILLFTFYSRLSDSIDRGNTAFFIYVHVLPICILTVSCLVFCAIEISQHILDKKGMEEIAANIYEKYSVMADKITDEQWEDILISYQKRPKKQKNKKTSKIETNKTEV